MLGEISQRKKHRQILYDLTYMWNLKKKKEVIETDKICGCWGRAREGGETG